MLRKFNLTNGVSVVITEELAIKYELNAAVNNADFVSILASIVSAQDRKKGLPDGGVPLPKLQASARDMLQASARDMLQASARDMLEDKADEEELKRRFFGERIEPDIQEVIHWHD